MIKISNLTKDFKEVKAVDNLTLEFNPGVTGLVGHNGAGKSTLFRLIAGIYTPTSGTISVNDYDSESVIGKDQVFFLSDTPYGNGNSTCQEVFNFYNSYFKLNKEKFNDLLDSFELPLNRKVGNFSKGMRRQLYIAIALSSDSPILLLDEAFDGLDPLVLELIKEEIIKISQEKTIVVSSHNIATLERLCDRFVILHKGKIGKEGQTEDMAHTFTKYQAIFAKDTTAEDLKALGLSVLNFKKIGSIYNFVVLGEDNDELIQSKLAPTLLEKIVIDSSELIALEMLLARKGDK